MARYFSHAQDTRIDTFQVFGGHSSVNPLEKLEALIAPEALYDSAERCDAPKCHPETRVAVQDDLYSWIEHGDVANPNTIKWITGPAGTGKTAVMGSITERCKKNGFPVASFFFSSTGSIGRRTKTAFVATIAHQLAQHRQDLKDAIAAAIEADAVVFKKNLHVQMETLVLAPLRAVAGACGTALRGVIVVDGLDECQVENINDNTTIRPSWTTRTRTKEQDQTEILQVLHQASSDTSFPYRILIASRPERVFREFFDPENGITSFAQNVDLNEHYNADADIALFLESQFNRIRRRYAYPPSWPSPGAIQALVKNASGQFIYAATVIRVLDAGYEEPPKPLLEAILQVKATRKTSRSNPFEQLDALYAHILESSPDLSLSVLWIRSIQFLTPIGQMSASDVDLLLQRDPESREGSVHLLGNLHSLIRVPAHCYHSTSRYRFYHKTLLDFLGDPDRCGSLYVNARELGTFIWGRFIEACERGCGAHFLYPETFLEFLVNVPKVYLETMPTGSLNSETLPSRAGAGCAAGIEDVNQRADFGHGPF